MFYDREEGGRLLAQLLTQYKDSKDVLVLGLPRGGVVTAYEVAKSLHLPLDVICPRKIGAPNNPEYAIGAVTETGEGVFNEAEIERLGIPDSFLKASIAEQTKEAHARLKLFRSGKKPLILKDKRVIIVDDGIATGLTMKASIQSLRKSGAKEIVVAVPVAPPESIIEIETLADQVFCLLTPPNFYAVGQFYQVFGQTSNEEVIELLISKDT